MGFFEKAREAAQENAKKQSGSQEVTPEMRAQAAQLDEVTKAIARPLGVDPNEASEAREAANPAPPAKPTAGAKPLPKPKPGQKMTFLGRGVSFEGDIRTRGDLKINGFMKGRIDSRDGRLELGTDARIEAKVAMRHFVVAGAFKGTVQSAQKIEVRSTGRLEGDVKTRSLLLDEGGVVEGRIHMDKT